MVREPFNIVLDSVRDIAPGVKHFAFTREDGKPLEFTPGQFIQLWFKDDEGEPKRRSYSIASIPGRDTTIDMAVSEVVDGFATRRFWALKPGDSVPALGPFGRLVLRDEPATRYVLVATGTGVTPYRAMLPQIAKRLDEGAPEVRLMMGVRTPADLLYGDEFVRFAEEHARFQFTAHYSREMPDAPEPWERAGYVQHAFDDLGLNPDTDVVYLCGNPNMIDEAMGWLTARGFTAQRVRREKYISGA
ncbi:MAG: FAD-binding oxidoreductase [Gammaproteobacteria bacterium]